MEPDDFNPADLDEVLTVLRAAGIRAEVDPAKVKAPGVWLWWDGLELDMLHGLTINARVYAVVPEADTARAVANVAAHFNQVKAVLRAAGLELEGTVERTALILPASSTPLPALACSLPLSTCQT